MTDHVSGNIPIPAVNAQFTAATAQYQIFFRSIDFDGHASRLISEDFDKNFVEKKLGLESGFMGFANSEYVEIMGPEGTVDSRFQGLGLNAAPDHPTGFKMTPNDRLVAIASGIQGTPHSKDPIFHDDAHFDQDQYPGQLQRVDNADENMLVATVSEGQMLQIKLAMLTASIQINEDNPGFGMSGWVDPNSNGFRNTMGEVTKETIALLNEEGADIKIDTDFDPDGWSPGSNHRIATNSVTLFEGSTAELKQAVLSAETTLSSQLDRLRNSKDINQENLKEPLPETPVEATPGMNGSGN